MYKFESLANKGLSIFGLNLLSKSEGISNLIYPCSMYVSPKDIIIKETYVYLEKLNVYVKTLFWSMGKQIEQLIIRVFTVSELTLEIKA